MGDAGWKRWRITIAALIVAAGVAVTGPTTTAVADEEPPPNPPAARCARLGVIGDSLILHSKTALAASLHARGIDDFRIDAHGSRRIPVSAPLGYSGVKALRAMRAAGYQMDCYMVGLGTNDIGLSSTAATYAMWIRQLLTEIGDHPVLWVNIARPKLQERVEMFHGVLAALVVEFPKLVVADWASVMDSHPDWFTPDRTHLRSEGRAFRGEWMAAQTFDVLFGVAPVPLPADCAVTRTLHRKTTGTDVLCVEHRLAQLGYVLPNIPDEIFDTRTAKAVADFQKHAKLAVNGVVGPKTAAALGLIAVPPN